MKEIKLDKGYTALVDDSDYEFLNQWTWHFNKGYASRTVHFRDKDGKRKEVRVLMHRQILGLVDPSIYGDHINLNKLDNRKCNLRLADKSTNCWNKGRRKTATSQYIGVCYIRERNTWRGTVYHRGRTVWQKDYKDEKEAALARDIQALKYRGEYAKLNFPLLEAML
jgi:hypothetical protein